MSGTEAEARIKINKMLEEAGWRLCDDENGKKNVDLETATKVRRNEQERKGAIDYLLLDSHNFPLCVLEAKKESINPLSAKDQARAYAEAQGIRFVILSNSQIHYLWDIKSGNPQVITTMPSQESLENKKEFKPNPKNLTSVDIIPEYVALLKNPNLLNEPEYQDKEKRGTFCWNNGYRILRPYQVDAVKAVQKAVNNGQDRFLLEMATGLGKTLTAGALIKLFLSTGNANRVLFLVDRLELENQAKKNFDSYLNAYTSVIYKQNKSDWKKAQIVITTIQSLLVDNKYKKLFSPTDFDLLISDEAHRCIGGNSRAVFEYFIGYKLGLTATPKDYIKNVDIDKLKIQDPKSLERRILLDTYNTFGCESGEPTFRYSLLDGVRGGYLINPLIVDARTEITTDLLSEKGYAVTTCNEYGDEVTEQMYQRDFEKKFFSDNTNAVFCKTFLENALRDPISGEIGKSLVFGVSQNHCAKLVQILNEMADIAFPGMYNSDFAVQITSNVMDAQQSTIDFSNDKLNGRSRFMEGYETSKTRVCVTVGMMTTGYDCSDILNIALMRPVFSPTDFVQIKGRGTRKHTFKYTDANKQTITADKTKFKFFDFFANCQYFDEEFNYDEELKLPPISGIGASEGVPKLTAGEVIIDIGDTIKTIAETPVGLDGMRIDREFFQKTEEAIKSDEEIKTAVDNENWDRAIAIVKEKYENQPDLYMNLEKIKKSQNLDRRVTWREVLEKVFGFIDGFKNKDDLLEDECDKFISIYKPEPEELPFIKNFIKAYTEYSWFRDIIDKKEFQKLHMHAGFSVSDYQNLKEYKDILPTYIKENINLNTYM